MAESISAAAATAQLSALMASAAYGGKRYIIKRRGRPIATLVSVDDLRHLEEERISADRTAPLSFIGAWGLLDDGEIDQMVSDIYTERMHATGRPVILEA